MTEPFELCQGEALTHSVIAYTLLCGYSPFRSDDKVELVKETTRGKITFHERYWKKVSDTGGSLFHLVLHLGMDGGLTW
jgi:hypothetical protein